MYNINDLLKREMENFNDKLVDKYRSILSIDRENFRELINREVGAIIDLEKLSSESLSGYEKKGGIVGVDGSNNKKGGAYPHYVELFQAMAKSSIKKQEAIFKCELSSPILKDKVKGEGPFEDEERELEEEKNKILSRLEVEVALESIDKHKPYAIIMDGSLIRYHIYSKDEWLQLRAKCEEENIILIGVIEEIKTSMVADSLGKLGYIEDIEAFDKEVLFGKLNMGEAIEIKDNISGKENVGLSSMFMRTSLDPTVIAIDLLDSQKEELINMANLVYSLTPENSRGIPLWLDLVDEEVKISDRLLEALMETYLDRDIYEKFFIPTRSKRKGR